MRYNAFMLCFGQEREYADKTHSGVCFIFVAVFLIRLKQQSIFRLHSIAFILQFKCQGSFDSDDVFHGFFPVGSAVINSLGLQFDDVDFKVSFFLERKLRVHRILARHFLGGDQIPVIHLVGLQVRLPDQVIKFHSESADDLAQHTDGRI